MNEHVKNAILAYHGKQDSVDTDVLGSYTGTTDLGYAPVQDADDL